MLSTRICSFFKKNQTSFQQGSVLVLSSFLLLAITIITVSFWRLLEVRISIAGHHEQESRAYYAARAGIEDAIYEFVEGAEWAFDDPLLSQDWQYLDEDTFYKTNVGSDALSYFDYPVTFSVTVLGDINDENVTINSAAKVRKSEGGQEYQKTLEASVVKSFDGDVFIMTLEEVSDG